MAATDVASRTDSSSNLTKWDFTNIRRIDERCLRIISHQHSQCAKKISVTLAGLLRSYVDFDVAGVSESRWADVLNSIPAPCALFMVKASSSDDPILVNVDLKLAFGMVDRLLGGSGESSVEARELTPIEKRILSKPIQKIVNLLAASLNEYSPVTFTLGELISNPELIDLNNRDDVAVAVVSKVKVGNLEGNISVFYPLALFAPILSNLQRAGSTQKTVKAQKDHAEALLRHVSLPISIRFSPSMVNIEHLIGLQKGDVILLDRRVNDEVEVYVGTQNIWMGRPGNANGRIAVKLTRLVKGGKQNAG